MAKLIPDKLNDFKVYVNGSPDLKGVADLQLPSFEAMTDTISGSGIAGEIESPSIGHFQSMKLTVNWTTILDDLTEFFKPQTIMLDCRLANQEFNPTKGQPEIKATRVVVKGIPVNNNLGSAQKNSKYEGSTEIEVLYIKVERDRKVLVELDKVNYIYKVGGVDYMAQIREALGM